MDVKLLLFDVKFCLENLKDDNCKHSFFFQVRLLLQTGLGMPEKWGSSKSVIALEGEEHSGFMYFKNICLNKLP